ncbi:MAG: MerR family transcriptional regulator [Chloroflexi bacterium]|nr:MAG: MerR family transcriptional regulator [Chloroflexota bacterium]
MESGGGPVTQSYDKNRAKAIIRAHSILVKLKSKDSAAAASGTAEHDAGIDLDKPIFTLSVASEILETHPRTLMMYEHLDMIRPKRTVTNRRRYSRRDVMKLQAIQTLTRKHGVNLAGVRYILALLKRLEIAGIEPPEGLRTLDVSLLDV